MEFKGTPGKWHHYDDSDTVNRRHEIVAVGKTIAHIYCSNPKEDRFNAQAIAAVPQMIEALGRALNAPRGTSGRIILEMADEEILRAALTAAVGE